MKKIILITILIAAISGTAFSQQQAKKDNILFMLREEGHMKQAFKTIEELKKSKDKIDAGKIVIIMCGDAVNTVFQPVVADYIAFSKKHPGLTIEVCGLSLDRIGKSKKDLPAGIGYTKNGFIEAFYLQKKGFISVEM